VQHEIMKVTSIKFSRLDRLSRRFLFTGASLVLAATQTFAADVNATYAAGNEVPVTADGFTAEGKTINLILNYVPSPGTQLMVVRNTSSGIIRGNFANLAQGQTITLTYSGLTYHFVANYYGGNGNDLVLLWTVDLPLPATAVNKLDGQIVLALKKSSGLAPFDKPTSLEPDIPIKDAAGRVLVDIEASVSQDLLDQVAPAGGQVINGSATATSFRAMIPLSQLGTLANRTDIKSISVARPTITSVIKP
jgi:hypothetical protein